ncbi:MFS transporter [Bradyrhizobium sp. AUGA SZCCT0042]|uniref:MFS transporter n=1 Tax=Bradyrhizobium sp. AUGA SZCCT0042 TaxID=2807651 RepID=UPI001BA6344C|nr:MFS transporter [Bradyrhizobium sp. AUGA SZCCT0042]MBR1301267.1 MFS transporter [Bradyrhizobium sp. AUGA SZCCT0042]
MNQTLSAVAVPIPSNETAPVSRAYAWAVFALTFGLMLSDYLSRQVIGAVMPALKAEWGLLDTQLGMLVSVVSLVVGLLTVPISLVADRWGRVKSITLMAFVWCLATVACGLAQSYGQLLGARALVGLGEAAYGAVGAALLAHVFPEKQRAAVLGAFLSASLFGSVLGVVIGGAVAAQSGWRMAFFAVGAPGLLLALIYPFVVRDYKAVELTAEGQRNTAPKRLGLAQIAREVFASRSGNFAYVASGLQMVMPGMLIAWLPTYFGRYYDMDVKKAALMAAVAVLAAGIGMIFGGGLADRLSAKHPRRRALVPAVYSVLTALSLIIAFALPPGPVGFGLILLGALFAAAQTGCSAALVCDVTHPGVRSTVAATMTLANSLIGLAPGPFIVGILSDFLGLKLALTLAPVLALVAAVFFVLASRNYEADSARNHARSPEDSSPDSVHQGGQ